MIRFLLTFFFAASIQHSYCQSLEICDNEEDDDLDGLVDLYDPDCECNDQVYNAFCEINCEFVPDQFPNFIMEQKWIAQLINPLDVVYSNLLSGDVDDDQDVEIVAIARATTGNKDFYIVVLDGLTGLEENRFLIQNNATQTQSITHGIAMGDVDLDGKAEFFVKFSNYNLAAYDDDGSLMWESSSRIDEAFTPGLADFNSDGVPEVYVDDYIFNSLTGAVLAKGISDSKSGALFTVTTNSIAADVLPNPGLELVDGNIVYIVEIINPITQSGNTMVSVVADLSVSEGFTSVADIDGDGNLDVIVHRDSAILPGGGGLWVWNPRTTGLIASFTSGESASVPFVGDVNSDCQADIGVVSKNILNIYTYDASATLRLLWSLVIKDRSGATGITMFDFNQDGKNELVYRDEDFLRIINGETGTTITTFPVRSTTFVEYPIIVDIDNDKQAEILVQGYNTQLIGEIYAFESADQPWAPTREVWNQYSYNVTNINDNLTIPRSPQNPAVFIDGTDDCLSATCPQPYNGFLTQATFRTQNGCVQFPTVDLEISLESSFCTSENEVTICLIITNLDDDISYYDSVKVSFFGLKPLVSDNLFLEETVDLNLDPGEESPQICIVVPSGSNGNLYFVSINAEITSSSISFPENSSYECNYANNIDSIILITNMGELDLGPDLVLCPGAPIVLDAGDEFSSYSWNTEENISSIEVSQPGDYSVVVTDICQNTLSDSISVSVADIDILKILGNSIETCEESAVYVSLYQGGWPYTDVLWGPSNIIDCPTCENIMAQVDSNTVITVSANVGGCVYRDSLLVEIKETVTTELNETICYGDSLLFGGSYYFNTDVYGYNVGLCDSVFTINLEVGEMISDTLDASICPGDSISIGPFWYDTSDNILVNLTSATGCDSSVLLRLTMKDSINTALDFTLCAGDSLIVNGSVYSEAGSYRETITIPMGCDSIVDFTIDVEAPILEFESHQICQGEVVKIGNHIFSTTTQDTLVLQTSTGCDSIIYVDVIVDEIFYMDEGMSICSGDSVEINGIWISDAGEYPLYLFSQNGCDSTISIDLNVNETYYIEENLDICTGDSVQIYGVWVSDAGEYPLFLVSQNGCDSIINIIVEVESLTETFSEVSICAGDSVFVYDEYITVDGVYVDTIPGVDCDAIISTTVIVNPPSFTTEELFLCPADTLFINGTPIHEGGSFPYNYFDENGCDSVHTYIVTEIPEPGLPVLEKDCDSGVTMVSIPDLADWNVKWSNGSEDIETAYDVAGPASVELFNISEFCEVEYFFYIGGIPALSDLPTLPDITIGSDEFLPLNFDLDPDQWQIEWSSEYAEIDCLDCDHISISSNVDTEVSVTYIHSSGCEFEDSFFLTIKGQNDIYIPNIFSPNGDNTNDIWSVYLDNSTNINLSIFDRWGNRVASWKNSSIVKWDGTMNGTPVVEGIYVYYISYMVNKQQIEIAGDIMVIR